MSSFLIGCFVKNMAANQDSANAVPAKASSRNELSTTGPRLCLM